VRRMPRSVIVAVTAIGAVAIQLALTLWIGRASAGWAAYASSSLVAAMLLYGLARRSRLAWLWGRWLSLLLAAAVAARLALGLYDGEFGWTTFALALSVFVFPLLAAGLALQSPSAYAFYDLVCPECGMRAGMGADLLFRTARCRRCGHEW
jgi:hypothetical protein